MADLKKTLLQMESFSIFQHDNAAVTKYTGTWVMLITYLTNSHVSCIKNH